MESGDFGIRIADFGLKKIEMMLIPIINPKS
jgi:hypothetical protein